MNMPPPGQWPPPQSPQPGPPPQGMPPGPPNWGPPQQWGPQPPQNGGNRAKWILGGLALLVVVVVTVVATLLFTRGDSGTKCAHWLPLHQVRQLMHRILQVLEIRVPSESSLRIRHVLRGRPLRTRLPNSNGTAGIGATPRFRCSDMVTRSTRSKYLAVADAMRSAADQTAELMKLTPHRVMRELY